jgi:predicted nuclease of restriction endonuclease-like RecB superfamily
VVPHFLLESDLPWLRVLLEERDRFVGRRQRELEERLREPLPCASPAGKRALAIHVLQRLPTAQRRSAVPSRLARAAVFGEAARSSARGNAVLVSVATSLRVTPDELGDSLFADLPGERLVAPLEKALSSGELALRTKLRSGDPIFPSPEPRAYDSRLEERFARDFRRTAPDWDLVREPEPVVAGNALVFPDFALQHRLDPSRRWLLEIVGFWTPEYLARKLASYRAAGLSNLILCIDDERNCAEQDLPAGALVLRFRRRVDATAVHRLVDAQAIGPNPDGRHTALL